MIAIFSFVLFWLVCASLATSAMLAFFQRKFSMLCKQQEYREDLSQCWLFGLVLGPVGLFVAVFLSGFFQFGLMNPFVLNKYKD